MESLVKRIPYFASYFGGVSQQRLYFVPDADNKPDVQHEISDPTLFRFLLNEETFQQLDEAAMLDVLKDVDKQSKITEFETHQSSMGSVKTLFYAFHVFTVFKTTSEKDGDYWWSLEKGMDCITLQRSRNKENVKDKLDGQTRTKVKSIVENLKGKGTIQDLFEILWAQQLIPENYHIKKSNCQSFVTCISQQITEVGYEYKGFFNYSPPPESGREKKMLDLINILRGFNGSGYPPLLTLIEMGNIDLVDKMIKSGDYDINDCINEHIITPLHWAIIYSKTEMVKHLLKPPLNADPPTSALHVAAMFTMKMEIFDSLLAHSKVKVDEVDGNGQTALHWAASKSNVVAVQKLLENGANPNLFDKNKMSPLHVAARQRDGIPIIDLLLEAQKVKGMGDVNDRDKEGWTALHYAAFESNEITAEHLIKKGAELHCQDNMSRTPLDVAAMNAKDMQIIDVLLKNITEGDLGQHRKDDRLFVYVMLNMHGLEMKMCGRLLEKGKMELTPSSETDDCTGESDEATGVNTRRFEDKSADPSIDLTGFDGLDFLIARFNISLEMDEILKEKQFDINGRDENGDTPLILAIRAHNVDTVGYLLKNGADPTIRNSKGFTPFHLSVDSDEFSYLINLLLLGSGKVDINETTSYCGLTALHLAIINSNLIKVCFLLCRRANPNVADENGATPLHWAARNAKDLDIVELLLEHEDLDINCLDKIGRNALDYATMNTHGHGERIANLLKEKGFGESENELAKGNNDYFKKHMRDYLNRKPSEIENCVADDTIPIKAKIDKILENKDYLVSAAKNSNVESVRLLLKNGADTKTWGEMGGNALHLASLNAETTDVIDVVLETEKFDINGVDSYGLTPLYWAIMTNNLEIARHLIRKGADPTVANKDGNTPLHAAVYHIKSIETVSLLLENKQVDINRRDKNGLTALHYAISAMEREQSNNVEMVRYLLEKGADPTIRNNNGTTPFHLSTIFLTNTDVLGLMLENDKKIDIDEKKNDGFNALHIAIGKSKLTTARFLLSKGANPNVTDKNGATPLHLAVLLAKDMDIVELLLNHPDVDVNYLDNRGIHALYYAMGNEHGFGEEIFNLLREKGAVLKEEGNKHEPENIATLVDSFMENFRYLLEKAQDSSAITEGENGANAHHLTATFEKIAELIDSLQETNLYAGPTAPDCTSDDNNENMVKEVLKEAIRQSDAEKVRNLIEMGADLGKTTWRKGVNALHVASRNAKKTEILDIILETGDFDINGRDENGITALYYAIIDKNVETVRYLLEKGADPTIGDNEGTTPFHLAAALSRETDILDLCLANNNTLDIDHPNQSGMTALHMAATDSNSATAKFLLAKGANPNVTDENGRTPLHAAVLLAKDMDIVKLLLNHQDVDVDYLDKKGYNALHCAMGNIFGLGKAIANLLREKMAAKAEGSNHELENMAASVPGGRIKEDSDKKTIRLLIENGQDVSAMTWGDNGANALHLAAADEETTDLIDVILETGKFDINGVDNDGRTPLHYAIKRPKPITINSRRLIKMGANPSVPDKNGVTPLHMAARNAESMDLIELLLNTEAVDVNHYDHNGTTPLAYARANKHGIGQRIIARLKEYDDEKK